MRAMREWRLPIGLVLVSFVLALHLSAPADAQEAAASPRAPEAFRVRLQTTKGVIDIQCTRAWAPRGADRFHDLVRQKYYDDVAFSRVIARRWAQFGINGDPFVAKAWRARTIPDDPFQPANANLRGTVAFAFAVPNGRTTQVFINLTDNRVTHDKEPFVPFGRVDEAGLKIADALYSGYGEEAGSGIRSGKQGPLFDAGNAFLRKAFPRLDYIVRATVER